MYLRHYFSFLFKTTTRMQTGFFLFYFKVSIALHLQSSFRSIDKLKIIVRKKKPFLPTAAKWFSSTTLYSDYTNRIEGKKCKCFIPSSSLRACMHWLICGEKAEFSFWSNFLHFIYCKPNQLFFAWNLTKNG